MTTRGLAEGTVLGGDYKILRPLGAGGMGAVYAAEQLSTGRQRALKVLHPNLVSDDKRCERFLREARISAKIASDNVVEVVGAGVDPTTGLPWIAMELLDGELLTHILEKYGTIPAAGVYEIAAQVCDALGRAHAAGIVHADLKPDNLFVAVSRRRGATFEVKVLDFGISRLTSEQSEAKSTLPMGSPMWMAPEQAQRGLDLAPATDVWALGLLVFNLLTGRSYWKSANLPDEQLTPTAILMEMMVGEMPVASVRARELGSLLSPSLDGWFARCLSREMSGRFESASRAWDALEQALRPAPVAAVASPSIPPPSPSFATGAAVAATRPIAATQPLPTAPFAPMVTPVAPMTSAITATRGIGPIISPGMRVIASWGGAANARGVAMEVNPITSLVRVRFDDGHEAWVALSNVRT